MKVFVFLAIIVLALTTASHAMASPPGESLAADIEALTAEIKTSQADLEGMDARLETTTKDIIQIYQEIDSLEAQVSEHRRVFNSRIQDIYMNYSELIIDAFLNARNFNDLWKRFSFFAKINQTDKDLLAANKFRLQRIEGLKRDLAQKKDDQVDLKRQKQQEFLALEKSLMVKKSLLEERLAQARAAQAAAAANAASAAPISNTSDTALLMSDGNSDQ